MIEYDIIYMKLYYFSEDVIFMEMKNKNLELETKINNKINNVYSNSYNKKNLIIDKHIIIDSVNEVSLDLDFIELFKNLSDK